MKIQCNFCGNYLEDTDETCPNCGGVNQNVARTSNETPKTIEELQKWYVDHNLPPEEITRFFIGKDVREARAFGIYREGTEVIVYKNKDTGERAIRYQGTDEAYGVNEIYLKLKERIAQEKAKNAGRHAADQTAAEIRRKNNRNIIQLFFLSIAAILGITMVVNHFIPNKGYYNYNGDTYYYLDSNWYIYDDGWYGYDVDDELSSHYSDYYAGSNYYDTYGDEYFTDFEDTSYYQDWYENQSSDWDSGSSWDSGDSWDSGGGDWGSDW